MNRSKTTSRSLPVHAVQHPLDCGFDGIGNVIGQPGAFEALEFEFLSAVECLGDAVVELLQDRADLTAAEREQVRGRSMVVKRLQPLPVEAVVRGYLIGSGWKDYQASGSVCGMALPARLQQAQELPEPIFTPATKAEQGAHDENISFERLAASGRMGCLTTFW